MSSKKLQKYQKKVVFLWTLLIVFFFLIIVFSNIKNSTPLISDNQINDNQNTAMNNEANKLTSPKQPTTCTNFKYSEWSNCNEDGEQYRTITEMLPSGCIGGNPLQMQKCEYKISDIGTAPEIINRIITQIRNAPNQTIDSSYVSGANSEMLQNLSYKILDDYFVIKSTLVHRDTNSSEPTVDFIDTNLDGFVDYWADEDRILYEIDKNGQEYSQIQTIWGIYLVNFANHHLK